MLLLLYLFFGFFYFFRGFFFAYLSPPLVMFVFLSCGCWAQVRSFFSFAFFTDDGSGFFLRQSILNLLLLLYPCFFL